jgi:hypothetical protein
MPLCQYIFRSHKKEVNFMSSLIKAVSAIVVLAAAGGGYYVLTQKDAAAPEVEAQVEQDADAMTIQFGNNTWVALASLELSPTGTDTYVSVPLEDGALAPGQHHPHPIAGGSTVCTYDIRAAKDDGATATFDNVNLCDVTFYNVEEAGFE